MLLLQHRCDLTKTFLSGIGTALRLGGVTIALAVICTGVSSGETPDVFEDAFAAVPWQTSPRSSRIVQSSQWRRAPRQSVPRDVSRKVAYEKVTQSSDDEGYVLDPVDKDQIQGPIAEPMEMYADSLGYETSYDGAACGDPGRGHPWQGGEYWFNPRYGLPPFMCRFPHWMRFTRGRLWFRGEYLLWWMAGSATPPLVTSSSAGTARANAGVLGYGTTSILYGDEKLNASSQSGGRFSIGYWFSDAQCFGWELNYLDMGDSKEHFSTDTNSTPIIARPFTNAVGGAQDAALLSFPDALQGSVQVESISEFQSFEFLLRRTMLQRCDQRIDVVFGYRYGRLNDRLTITDNLQELENDELIFNGYDRFQTRNRFNGVEFGVVMNKRYCRWGFEVLAKLALGRTSSRVEINGATTIIDDGDSQTHQGDVLALPSNIGVYKTKEVAVMPEIGVNLMYSLTPRASLTFGYTFIYLSHVARPGEQIDLTVNSSQFPPGTLSGVALPRFRFRTTDFWAHGMNFGFDYRF